MKRILFILLPLLAFGCQQKFDVEPIDTITTEKRSVENYDFTRVKLFGEITLEIDPSLNNSIEVETDEAFQKYLFVDLRGKTLEIKRSIAADLQNPVEVKVCISANHISRFIVWRDSHVIFRAPLVSDTIEMELQKNSTITGEIECNALNALVHDNSRMELVGRADIVNLEINESSEASCPNLSVTTQNVESDTTSSYIFR